MSDTSTRHDSAHPARTENGAYTATRRVSSETKPSFKTTELIVFVLAVVGVLVASAIADEGSDFGAQEAWKYVTALAIGYMVSRGLAKSGSRDFHDDSVDDASRGR